ncbi:GTP cyclohydrolase I FolE [Paradevosia shaoguanensis]|uniref:GTP cyclohydrolase 1 n=1 Tax=Paradevosia shaoguanensis TaxID=1335043 RepID=A0AA41QMT8_9HYPH|nr:GTP cyclohydrolase I FolE [Paradevosia shaoguanensis]KFL28675.1 GTP cyclohydrolase [Devosia sp. 17-2-E-8]MBI4045456.1 GTP cyclohydrolase I FolE [Devosia nanyangense]QMV01571.1 GTP cyclohydrolase I FolE [Devosia sp. D6-9]CDP53896.1 GTP cyclohydrolase I type 1 [Devosia sp. DBB001]MCF1743021.1 GTP cyclohydrolase I FolE [Paradevosia shaoguanensis]
MDATAKSGTVTALDKVTRHKPSQEEVENAVRTLIAWAGDDPTREGLIETPGRVARAYSELFAGYEQSASDALSKIFREVGGYDDIVLLKDIPFHSHCEHHMVPFFGKAHIAYLPHEGVVGLSKLARLVDVFARRLQTQETMTQQIIDALNENLNPRGAAVMLEAEHMCMTMRGVHSHGVTTITHRFTGVFAEEREERERFFAFVGKR